MQVNATELDYYRRIIDEFRVAGTLESKEGRTGFRAKVLVDFLTCENGFSASTGKKYADSRFDAVSRIGRNLVKLDFIHHYRDAVEFGDDDGFFRFLDDEPSLYFEKRQTVLSLRSPLREVRAGKVLWTCEDILLGSDLEVHNNFCISNETNEIMSHVNFTGVELCHCAASSTQRRCDTVRFSGILRQVSKIQFHGSRLSAIVSFE